MSRLLFDLFEDSRDISIPLIRTSTMQSTRFKASVGQSLTWHVTRSSAKLKNEDVAIEGLEEEDNNKKT